MSHISFKNFLEYTNLTEEHTEEELMELFGFGADKKKVADLKAANAKLKSKADDLKMQRAKTQMSAPPASARSVNALDREADRTWGRKDDDGSDPRKVYKSKTTWDQALQQLKGKIEVSGNTGTDSKGRVVAKWNPDKMEGYIELRD